MEIYQNLSLENLPNEEWRDVVGYEGLYKVSNLGRVKMLERKVLANKSIKTIKEHLIKQIKSPKGYLFVDLWTKNKNKRVGVHICVLMSFCPTNNSSLECNHINENRDDNRIENLEWLTHKENLNYGNRTQKHKQALLNHPKMSKGVILCDKKGNVIKEYPSMREVIRELHIGGKTLKDCCDGIREYKNGLTFKYKK